MNTWMGRRSLLIAAALLSLAATGWLAAQETTAPDLVEPTGGKPVSADTAVAPAEPARAAQQDSALRPEGWSRDAGEPPVKELFAVRSWQAQAKPVQELAPPPPSAPTVPFVYIGKMIHEGKTVVFLTHQDRSLAVKEGDVIDGSYRIDSIKGAMLTLTYLPLDTAQTIHIGDQN